MRALAGGVKPQRLSGELETLSGETSSSQLPHNLNTGSQCLAHSCSMQASSIEPATFRTTETPWKGGGGHSCYPDWSSYSLCEHVFPVFPHKIPGQSVSQSVARHCRYDVAGVLLTDQSWVQRVREIPAGEAEQPRCDVKASLCSTFPHFHVDNEKLNNIRGSLQDHMELSTTIWIYVSNKCEEYVANTGLYSW